MDQEFERRRQAVETARQNLEHLRRLQASPAPGTPTGLAAPPVSMPERGLSGAIDRAMDATGFSEDMAPASSRGTPLDIAFLMAATEKGLPPTSDMSPPDAESVDLQSSGVDIDPQQLNLLRMAAGNPAVAAKLGLSQQEAQALLQQVMSRQTSAALDTVIAGAMPAPSEKQTPLPPTGPQPPSRLREGW
jgi:hypothetical protein